MDGDTNAPPPGAFLGSESEEAAIDRTLAAIDKVEGKKVRRRKWKGWIGWGVAGVLLAANVAQGFTIASLFPLKEVRHNFTLLREDGTSQVLQSSWDLPPSKLEQLIQATAVRYTTNCESWSWVHAKPQYDFCLALSAGSRERQYLGHMDRQNNPRAPQTIYGQAGVVRIIPTGVSRIAPNSIRVLYIRAETWPGDPARQPVIVRKIATLDYMPVRELPADLRRFEPTADVKFVRMEVSDDATPFDLNALAQEAPRQ